MAGSSSDATGAAERADADLDAERRHDLGVVALSDTRKIALLSGRDEWHLEAIPEFRLPTIRMSDGPHGLRKVERSRLLRISGSAPATCFPTGSALGASWDRSLLHEVGVAIASEAIASGVDVVLGPGVNIKRSPLCGRNFEYFSEDPLLSGELAAAFISGVQSLGVGACLKHFAVHSQETHRMVVDAVVDERTMREIYLRAFEIAITAARPWSVMCSYNRLNGVYSSENVWLLKGVLRDEWGFDGLVVTDWAATNDRVAAIAAGTDLEMPGGASIHDGEVREAVRSGRLDHTCLDRSAARVAQLIERTQRCDGPSSGYDFAAHHALARRAAASGTVLLKNDDAALPIEPAERVAMIGAFAHRPRFQGGGSSRVNARLIDNVLDRAREIASAAGGQVQYAPGYAEGPHPRPDLIDEAVAIARGSDVAVVFVGLPAEVETEGRDRSHLGLPERHDQLIDAVTAANRRTIVVLMSGAPVVMPWVDRPAAIVEAYLGGEAVGSAIADVLYGVSEPGGRLAETFPVRLADAASSRWFPGEPLQVEYREGLYVGYRWFDTAGVDVLFPFGHGLSYTTFELTEISLSSSAIQAGDTVTVSARVTNTGNRSGSEVVQIYVSAVDPTVDRPVHELRAFEKVRCAPSESVIVDLPLGPRAFAHWDPASQDWQVTDGRYEVRVGTSSRRILASVSVHVASDGTPSAVATGSPWRFPGSETWTVDDAAFAERLGRPVPAPLPMRPFDRNSTLGMIGRTAGGRPLLAVVRRCVEVAHRRSNQAALADSVVTAVEDIPLRALAAMSRGFVSLRTIDRLVAVVNRLSRIQR